MDPNGFFRYRQYEQLAQNTLGRTFPVIATEGARARLLRCRARLIRCSVVAAQREPYLMAFCPWLIGNQIGGGKDPQWEDARGAWARSIIRIAG